MTSPQDSSSKIFRDERKRAFLNAEGADRPLASPLPHATLVGARRHRLARLRSELVKHDCAAILLCNSINIRYALDARNMAVWTLHEPLRYALIFADGPAILFEFKGGEHLADGIEGIDEIRLAVPWIYMSVGEMVEERAKAWAAEIADLMASHGGGNRRLAIDRIEPPGLHALEGHGLVYVEGQQVTERARAIKNADEIALMRWTIRVCEAGMARVYEHSQPGRTEQELWAELSFENSRSGGEWMETRIFACGANTNPWYHECDTTPCRAGEMISFDTDMIGPYGYCADLSRSWTCGHTKMTNKQTELYRRARDQVEHNLALLKPGLSFAEFNEASWRIPERHVPFSYGLALHGVGLADEWPVVMLHPYFDQGYPGVFEENMVVCVESLMAEEGSESIKLETQVLITANGPERLDTFPWEDV